MYANESSGRTAQRGLTLIELMVGMVVAMLVVLAAASSGLVLSSLQRQASGTSHASTSGHLTLAALKQEIGQAGLGFFSEGAVLCSAFEFTVAGETTSFPSFAPLQVRSDGNNRQVIDVLYAQDVAGGIGVPLASDSDGTRAQLRSYLPAAPGDVVLLAPLPGQGGGCTTRVVDSVEPATTDRPHTLVFAAASPEARYPADSRAVLMGKLQWSRYRLDGTRLMIERPLEGKSAVMLRDVSGLVVQYGVSRAGETSIAEWVDVEGSWSALDPSSLARVRAVRVGLVTRSPVREREKADGTCGASADMPRLFGRAIESFGDWACWRYRSASVTVPLRNVVLGARE